MQIGAARFKAVSRGSVSSVALALTAVALTVAVMTGLAFAPGARAILKVDFVPIPRSAHQAVQIALHNWTKALSFGVFCVCALLACQDDRPSRVARVILYGCDAIVFVWWFATAALAGVLLGAYGQRQALAFLPQGPVELFAWALLIATYIDVRRARIDARQMGARVAVVVALLALSAVLELWAGL